MRALGFLAAAGLSLGGCVHYYHLQPAPGTTLVPGGAAVAEAAGIRTTVAVNTWSGWPSGLSDVLTPVHVTVENHSGHALRIQYRDFQLKGASGFRYAALPPFSLSGQPSTPPSSAPPADQKQNPGKGDNPTIEKKPETQAPPPAQSGPSAELRTGSGAGWEAEAEAQPATFWSNEVGAARVRPAFTYDSAMVVQPAARFGVGVGIRPRFHYYRFYSAPYVHYYYGVRPWAWGWDPYWYWGPYYYPHYYSYWHWTGPLPSQDMMEQALPEGVVEDGGHVSGFLYFQHVASREASVSFEENLVDARSNETFGSLSIPFVSR